MEAQDLEQQKIARMNSSSNQQDIKLYYKGNVQTVETSPKIQTAFSAGNQSGSGSQSSVNTSGFSNVNPPSVQSASVGNGHMIQCNVALHLQNGQNFSKEVVQCHMGLLVTALESYEGLIARRIGNPMLTKEDYDQIDAEELELMDIKWALASILRRAEKFKMITGRNDFLDAHLSSLGFDKSKVTCFKCREKGHFKRELLILNVGRRVTSKESAKTRRQVEQRIRLERMITIERLSINKSQINHIIKKIHKLLMEKMIEDANKKAYYGIIDQDDE
ncbi:putative transcription factor interactor and regulator CCHC(Zn) family [Helianthus annuus]|nr:putative transcription factor interactor and regulator CCHC(Zn) family [Helianthus annuus]